jgi:hypothetical protein
MDYPAGGFSVRDPRLGSVPQGLISHVMSWAQPLHTAYRLDEYFGGPLRMEDWRVSDGYYHYERDKSRYPAYPFRMSARDAARFGLLYARSGMWDDGNRILS